MPGEPPQSAKRSRIPTSKSTPPSNGAKKPPPKSDNTFHPEPNHIPAQTTSNQEFSLLQGVINKLPADKKWTQRQREKWIQAFTANVDLLIDVVDADYDLPYSE